MAYLTQVRYFWDYCASVNIILARATAKSNSIRQGKSSKGAELQQGTFVFKMKVELAKTGCLKFMAILYRVIKSPMIILSITIFLEYHFQQEASPTKWDKKYHMNES